MDTVFTRLDAAATICLQFCVASIREQLLFESSYYLNVALIKLGMEDEETHWLQMPRWQFEERLPFTLATATDIELEKSDPFADELEENKLILEDC